MSLDFHFSSSSQPLPTPAASQTDDPPLRIPDYLNASAYRTESLRSSPPAAAPSPAATPSPLAKPSPSLRELRGQMEELKLATAAELTRYRQATERRWEEFGAGMHRDMGILREETLVGQKTSNHDLFQLATQVSALNDRLTRLEQILTRALNASSAPEPAAV